MSKNITAFCSKRLHGDWEVIGGGLQWQSLVERLQEPIKQLQLDNCFPQLKVKFVAKVDKTT